MSRNRSFDDDKDRFWDIDLLIPEKKSSKPRYDISTVDISFGEDSERSADIPSVITQYIPARAEQEETARRKPLLSYSKNDSLIHRVTVYPWPSTYKFYEKFLADAQYVYKCTGQEAPKVPFFSYVPQYSQMSQSQFHWYLWWREQVRRGVFLSIDYSYILLYVYEIINLSDVIEPVEAQRMLCDVWVHYRETYPQLDRYLVEWICDYSLIHGLDSPDPLPTSVKSVLADFSMKEFYFSGSMKDPMTCAGLLMDFCSNYRFQKSKFASGKYRPLFEKHIPGAIAYVLQHNPSFRGLLELENAKDNHIWRDTFVGALCSYKIKRKIEVEYCSFSRSHELRFIVTDMARYTENKLRSLIGVRSRLSVYALDAGIKSCLDAYFEQAGLVLKQTSTSAHHEIQPVIEVAPRELTLSMSRAKEIEQRSWDVTRILVDAFESSKAEEPREPTASEEISLPHLQGQGVENLYIRFIELSRAVDATAQKRLCREHNVMVETVVDTINERALDIIGDVILVEDGDGYRILEDYIDEIEQIKEGFDH